MLAKLCDTKYNAFHWVGGGGGGLVKCTVKFPLIVRHIEAYIIYFVLW